MLWWKLLRGGLVLVAGAFLAQAIAFSFDGEGQSVLTYAVFYGIAGVLVVGVAGLSVYIHERQTGSAVSLEPPTIDFTLDGSSDLAVRLLPDRPQTVLLEVGVKNPNRGSLRGVAANILIPEGLRAGDGARCNQCGEHVPGGTWMRPTSERVGDEPEPVAWKDYWSDTELALNPDTRLFVFKLQLSEAGNYLRAKFWGGDVRDEIAEDAVLRVSQVDSHEGLTGRDRIGEAIHQGEELLSHQPSVFTGNGPPDAWAGWVVEAAIAVPEEHQSRFEQARRSGSKSSWRERTRQDIRALYDVRARL